MIEGSVSRPLGHRLMWAAIVALIWAPPWAFALIVGSTLVASAFFGWPPPEPTKITLMVVPMICFVGAFLAALMAGADRGHRADRIIADPQLSSREKFARLSREPIAWVAAFALVAWIAFVAWIIVELS